MRTTIERLENQVRLLNNMLGLPETPYTKADGRYVPNIGNLHISQAHGGVELHQMYNDSGGVSNISQNGHVSKPELDTFLQGMIAALRLTNETS